MKSVYGVYTQYEPTHKYEEHLESVWSTKDLAQLEANSIEMTKHNDWVMVKEIQLDKRYPNYDTLFTEVVQRPEKYKTLTKKELKCT